MKNSTRKQAGGIFGKLPQNCVIQFPSGTWGFVGSVDIRLGYLLDGHTINTDEDVATAASFSGIEARFRPRLKTRTYPTKEDAELAAESINATVTQTTKP